MKNLLLLPVLMFGLSFAAQAQEYEEVHGIKIGAPIESIEDLYSYENGGECEITRYHKNTPSNGLDSITIHVMEGVIEGVYFSIADDSFDDYIAEATTVFGDPINIKEGDDYTSYEYKGKNGIYRAELLKMPPYNFKPRNHAIYATKKLNENIERAYIECYE